MEVEEYSWGKNRYGFIGKENDEETGTQDHMFRTYRPSIGRYFSVDPLAPDYPWNSVYCYAENRVIDGLDLEGKEYVNYKVVWIEGVKDPKLSVVQYDPKDRTKFGKKGKGVNYEMVWKNKDGNVINSKEFFKKRTAIGDYGLYNGKTTLWQYDRNGNQLGVGDYSIPPIDALDEAARQHDMAYDAVGGIGFNGWVFSWATAPADFKLMDDWNAIQEIGEGGIDPVNGQKFTKAQMEQAQSNYWYFYQVATRKRNKIGAWMNDNYSKGFDHIFKEGIYDTGGWGSNSYRRPWSDNTKHNYEVFLKYWMVVDEKGYYSMREGMWEKTMNGTYKPKVLTKDELNLKFN